MGMDLAFLETTKKDDEEVKEEAMENNYMEGVRHLCDRGITKVPTKYILPVSDRPHKGRENAESALKLPIIDLAQLHTPNRAQVLHTLLNACEEYGFFHVVNHGMDNEVISRMVDVGRRFFELIPFEERVKYMSSDIMAPVRCGTSFNQMNDGVFFWRDFLKLTCQPLESALPYWPTSPIDLR